MEPKWYLGHVEAIEDNFEKRHNIRFSIGGYIDKPPFPIAQRMGEPEVEVAVGDSVMIFDSGGEIATHLYFYMPILTTNKVEMYSGVSPLGKKTNQIDLTYGGTDGSNDSKEIYIKSDNKITIESGSNKVVVDGKTGTISISARSEKGTGADITVTGNVAVIGDLIVAGDVSARAGLVTLSTHQHVGALGYPITPPVPTGTVSLLTSIQ